MLGWVEKAVPQPPGSSPIHKAMEKGTQVATEAQQPPDGIPHRPAAGSAGSEDSQDPVSTTESLSQSVINWLSHGLEKVIPQPVHNGHVSLQNVGKSFEASADNPDVTEIQNMDLYNDKLVVTVIEPDEEDFSDLQSSLDNNAPDRMGAKKLLTWLKVGFDKMVPQPKNMPKSPEGTPGHTAEPANSKENKPRMPQKANILADSPKASESKLRESRESAISLSSLSLFIFPQTLGGNDRSLFEWFVQGLEKVMPHPVTPTKQAGQTMEAAAMGSGQERSKGA